MKPTPRLILLLILTSLVVRAAGPEFPGLKAIMSEETWRQARLDRLDADGIHLIDAAFKAYLQAQAAPATPSKEASAWTRFGLGQPAEKSPADRLVMQAKVTAWQGANGFALDNGQVWAGIDPIRLELPGREIGIREGRLGSFILVVDGEDTSVRLRRVR